MEFVGAIIENPEFGFLLQQRDENAPSYPLFWTLFGGGVEPGETPLQAILRELDEEINLTRENILQIKKVQENIQENGNTQIIYYLLVNAALKSLTLKEGKQMKYVRKQDLFKRKFAFNIKSVLKENLHI